MFKHRRVVVKAHIHKGSCFCKIEWTLGSVCPARCVFLSLLCHERLLKEYKQK